jgi:hypothetical protein
LELRFREDIAMNFLINHAVFIVVITVLCFSIAAGTAVWEAWIDTRKRPREEMYWCSACRMYIRVKHCLELFPGMKTANGKPFLMCPICYKKAVYDDVDAKMKARAN